MPAGMDETRRFYDELAADYHLIFGDWDATVRGQGAFVSQLIGRPHARILDVAPPALTNMTWDDKHSELEVSVDLDTKFP